MFNRVFGLVWTAGALACSWVGLKAYHNSASRDQAEITYNPNDRNKKIYEKLTVLPKEFLFPIWGSNSHLQTGYNSVFRTVERPKYQRERLYASDGGLIVLDWVLSEDDDIELLFGTRLSASHSEPEIVSQEESGQPKPEDPSRSEFSQEEKRGKNARRSKSTRPTIVICPGICNNSEAHYIRGFASSASKEGYRVVIFTPRGCAELATTVKLFTYGDTSDLECTVDHVKDLFPNSPIIGVAFSLGSNLMCRYVGQHGAKGKKDPNYVQPFKVAVAVSLNADGHQAINHLKTNYPNTYYAIVSRKLISLLDRHKEVFAKELDVPELLKSIKTVEDYDREFTCKVIPTIAPESYYIDHSCKDDLVEVSVPTLLLNALDDPLVPHEFIPFDLPEKNKNIFLACTKYGGHLGWAQHDDSASLGFFLPSDIHWHDLAVLDFIASALSTLDDEEKVDKPEGIVEETKVMGQELQETEEMEQ